MALEVVVDKSDASHAKVSLAGVLNEDWPKELTMLGSQIGDTVTFEFSGLKSINSYGIRNWATFIRSISKGRTVFFQGVPSIMVLQMNVIPDISGGATVKSFYGDFLCEDCGEEVVHKFETPLTPEKALADSQGLRCKECGEALEMEVDIDSYFGFLAQD